jgi:hypothetical protein
VHIRSGNLSLIREGKQSWLDGGMAAAAALAKKKEGEGVVSASSECENRSWWLVRAIRFKLTKRGSSIIACDLRVSICLVNHGDTRIDLISDTTTATFHSANAYTPKRSRAAASSWHPNTPATW